MGGMIPLIQTRGLTVGHDRVPLVAGIGISLLPGKVLCVLGPNGVGKTTLFRTLLGLVPPLAGEIHLGGQAMASLGRAGIAARLAHVPQSLHSPFAYTAADIVLMGAASALGPFARPGRAEIVRTNDALSRLGIADLAGREVTRLSGGQKQLVLLARALAQESPAVLMDEPTASLDIVNRRLVDKAVRDLAAEGIGIILSTHDPDQAAALGDEALLLGPGGVVAHGPTAAALSTESLSSLYGTGIRVTIRPDGSAHFY